MPSLARRVLEAFGLLWLVTTLTFLLIHLAPGDPATLLVAPTASAEEAARLRASLGLDAPLAEQYVRWIGRLLRGDLGESVVRHAPVARLIAEAAPVSLALGGGSLLLSFLGGIALGWWQALRLRPMADRLVSIISTAVYAVPSFWLALGLVTLFTTGVVWLGAPSWARLPAFGLESPRYDPAVVNLIDHLRHAILPLLVLSIPGAAGVARFARQAFVDARGAPHVVSAYARGVPRSRVERRYIVRLALTPLVVLLGLMLPGVIAGSVFVEQVFAWPGLGRTMVTAIGARDYPLVLGLTLIYATVVIVANLLSDLLVWRLDPRRQP